MKIGKLGVQLIEEFEGCILQSYDDANEKIINFGDTPKGVLTIGVGHTSAAGPPSVYPGMKITKEQAEDILRADLDKVEKEVSDLVTVKINQNQFDALVSFHFNTGALGRSSALKSLNQGDFKDAADRLLLWNKAKQIGPGPIPGLVRRREAERKLFLTPVKETKMNALPFPLNMVFYLVSPDKIGSYVRGGVAAVLTVAVNAVASKVPLVAQFVSPDVIQYVAAGAGLAVAGFLGQVSKGDKVSNLVAPLDPSLDHSRKD